MLKVHQNISIWTRFFRAAVRKGGRNTLASRVRACFAKSCVRGVFPRPQRRNRVAGLECLLPLPFKGGDKHTHSSV